MSWLLIAVGGFIGACSRYLLSIWLNGKGKIRTAGTWLANIIGSALLAFLFVSAGNGLDEWIWLLAGTGFSGAFTTFSTFGKETIDMIELGNRKGAALYVLLSVAVSLVIVWAVLFFFR